MIVSATTDDDGRNVPDIPEEVAPYVRERQRVSPDSYRLRLSEEYREQAREAESRDLQAAARRLTSLLEALEESEDVELRSVATKVREREEAEEREEDDSGDTRG